MNGKAGEGVIATADELKRIEGRLQENLFPVRPRDAFVKDLKERLQMVNTLELEKPRPAQLQPIFLTAAGLLSGVLLIALGVRGLVALLKSLGGIQTLKNGLMPKKTAPVQPAL
jgi:hypothetical protein